MAVAPKHGEVWLADMGLAGKLRPVVVVLADGLSVERTLIVHVPVTTQNRGSVLEVALGHLRFLPASDESGSLMPPVYPGGSCGVRLAIPFHENSWMPPESVAP